MSELLDQLLDSKLSSFERLIKIMKILRSEDGCAWDRKQTHKSLLPYLIEETYEVIEVIENSDHNSLKEELGDLLCQIVFHAQIASERGEFDIDDSIKSISTKLINRHPHIFEEQKKLTPREVRHQWEKIKIESGEKKSVLSGLPKSMPALTSALRTGEKAGGVGFDWNTYDDVIEKIEEELQEIKAEIKNADKDRLTDEIGDLLFATASLARKLEIDPEQALKKALTKFKNRFDRMEGQINARGSKFGDFTLSELEEIWQSIK